MGKHDKKRKSPERLIDAIIEIITGLIVGIILLIIDNFFF